MPNDRLNAVAVFLASSAPGDPWDSSLYDEVLYVRGITRGTQRQTVDASNRNSPGNAHWAEFIAGQITKTVGLDGLYDLGQETGQQHIPDAIEDVAVQNPGRRWYLVTTDINGLEEVSGVLLFTNFEVGDEFNGLPSFTAQAQVTGAESRQVVS